MSHQATMSQTTDDEDVPPPKIYSAYWHPHKSLLDILIGILISFFLPLSALPASVVAQLSNSDNDNDDNDDNQEQQLLQQAHIQHAQKLRAPVDKMAYMGLTSKKNGSFHQWSAAVQCPIIHTTLTLPRIDNLFETWGIVKSSSEYASSLLLLLQEETPAQQQEECIIHVAFPETLLPDTVVGSSAVEETINKFGYRVLNGQEHPNLMELFPNQSKKDIPLIVAFHGGGMTVGNPRLSDALELFIKGIEGRRTKTTTTTTGGGGGEKGHAIIVNVQYSRAPEHPFPVAPLEACSVVSYFLDQGFEKIHLAGVSAGGYLALVAGLEAHRGHPKAEANLQSICAGCPMLNPACDSLSYYQNTNAHYVSVSWLRWCHQVHLKLPAPPAKEEEETDDQEDNNDNLVSTLLGRNSNRKAWKESKWAQSRLRRLAEPAMDVPNTLNRNNGSNCSLKFLLSTNAGDPLRDDGLEMVKQLQTVGASVSHHAHKGSHWIGTTLDKVGYQNLADEWYDILFPPTAQEQQEVVE